MTLEYEELAAGRLKSLPAVEAVLKDARIAALEGQYSREMVAGLVRAELQAAREAVKAGGVAPAVDGIVESVVAKAQAPFAQWPRRLVNATGVVLHTNLGRAPLSGQAIAAAASAAAGYSDLEFDLATGRRGSRNARISGVLARATGAEAGFAVNNNASGVLLVLSAIAAGKEVIVSRGEAVEIGGGFRVPDVMRQSGATLVEVGTTNRTYARDYEVAVTPDTAAILKVHPSNFMVTGFTHAPQLEELVEVGRRHGVPVLNDLGSGSLLDTRRYGMEHEPMAQESIAAGAGLTMFSGDKLLGGPQAGVIVGEKALVERVTKHPLARAVRIDKVTLAALSATLHSYIRGRAEAEVPVWQMISITEKELEARATAWRDAVGAGEVKRGRSAVGGGSLPGQTLPTYVLSIKPRSSADSLAATLRSHSTPVAGRIQDGQVLLDPRTVLPGEDEEVIAAVRAAVEAGL